WPRWGSHRQGNEQIVGAPAHSRPLHATHIRVVFCWMLCIRRHSDGSDVRSSDRAGNWTLFGILVPSAPEIAGYCMAASAFLALSYTFRNGGHVRVSLLLYQLGPKLRLKAEFVCLTVAMLLSAFFLFYLVDMTLETYKVGEVSSGVIAIPLVIPQTILLYYFCCC